MGVINYQVHKVYLTGHYDCKKCWYKFKRSRHIEWTENPFNEIFVKHGARAAEKKAAEELKQRMLIMDCPKCGAGVRRTK